jgi:hypothetical protein
MGVWVGLPHIQVSMFCLFHATTHRMYLTLAGNPKIQFSNARFSLLCGSYGLAGMMLLDGVHLQEKGSHSMSHIIKHGLCVVFA